MVGKGAVEAPDVEIIQGEVQTTTVDIGDLEIRLGRPGDRHPSFGTVKIDGKEITRVTALDIHVAVFGIPTVTITRFCLEDKKK